MNKLNCFIVSFLFIFVFSTLTFAQTPQGAPNIPQGGLDQQTLDEIDAMFGPQTEADKIKAEQQAKAKEFNMLKKDEQFWKSGDFEIKEGSLKFRGGYAYGLFNNATKKWVDPLGADKGKIDGRIAIFRKVLESDDYWIRKSGNIRILESKDKKYNVPVVWMYYYRQYDSKESYWNLIKKTHRFYAIENGEAKYLEPLGCQEALLINVNGKVGMIKPVLDEKDKDKGYKYDYCATETILPTKFDSIEALPSEMDAPIEVAPNEKKAFGEIMKCRPLYVAKKGNEVSFFVFSGKKVFNNITKYDSATELVEFADTFILVKKKDKYGAVSEDGEILIPIVYDSVEKFYNDIKDTYTRLSFSLWFNDKHAINLTTKDKFEKEADFQARMKDPQKQEKYVAEKKKAYASVFINNLKARVFLRLGDYDSEKKETFHVKIYVKPPRVPKAMSSPDKIIQISPLSWSFFDLKVPIKEAENFANKFLSIQEEALKNATFTIKYDTISIDKITFTVPNGKTYTFDSTKQ